VGEALTFTCTVCGEQHEGLPDFGFDAPAYYLQVPEAERAARCRLSSDFCVIDGQYHFVRAVLLIPVQGLAQAFGWGVWTSLSPENFRRCLDVWALDDPGEEGPYFGWLSNRLPFYPDTLELKLKVTLQPGGQRPRLELEPSDHPLAVDQREGIPWTRAVEMVEKLMHPAAASPED
jgi:hypothetical protein